MAEEKINNISNSISTYLNQTTLEEETNLEPQVIVLEVPNNIPYINPMEDIAETEMDFNYNFDFSLRSTDWTKMIHDIFKELGKIFHIFC